MAANKVAANQGSSETTAPAVACGPFEPCVWGDFFVAYTPPPLQRTEEWMRGRAEQLKGEVHRMFEAGKAMNDASDTLSLVDALERLGIDNHFREEIDVALSRIHGEDDTDVGSSHDLHTVALRFCLLRQHGFWVPTDVFDKFRDGMGNFNIELSRDPRDLLTLYNAAHMAVPGEAVLDDAIAFARRHLEAARGKLRSPLSEQVCRALETPRPRFMRRLETMHYISEYEKEEGHNKAHNATVLELARLDLNLVRSLHLKELRSLTLWWRNLYNDVKLPYARDRIVEPYFYACGIFHEEENSHIRIIFTKVFVLLGLMDDTYDVHATLEECQTLNEAIQRWDETAASFLPKYMRMLYIKTLSNINGIEDILEPFEKYRMMAHIQKQYKLQSNNYLQEAKWFNEKHIPSLKDHTDVTLMSTGLPFLFSLALMAAGQVVTKEALEWALSVPNMVRASGEIGRLLNDISSYKRGKNKNDVASTVESYMKEHGATGEEAIAAIKTMVEQAWMRINGACMELGRTMQPALQWLVDMTRMLEIFYLHGRDGLTYGYDIKEIVAFLFLKQVPV